MDSAAVRDTGRSPEKKNRGGSARRSSWPTGSMASQNDVEAVERWCCSDPERAKKLPAPSVRRKDAEEPRERA